MKFIIKSINEKEKIIYNENNIICELHSNSLILKKLSLSNLKLVLLYHKIHIYKDTSKENILKNIYNHKCLDCPSLVGIFQPLESGLNSVKKRKWIAPLKNNNNILEKNIVDEFPPQPLKKDLILKIIKDFCYDTSPSMFIESGCAVCGQLTFNKDLIEISKCSFNKNLLVNPSVARKERNTSSSTIEYITQPILALDCSKICQNCSKSLQSGLTPSFSLANGLWIGNIPIQLQNLTYMERLMIAKVRHSFCMVKVDSRRYKLKANVICFSNPISKVYNILPPSKNELNEIIAFQFTGPCKPTSEDMRRTPLFARLNKIKEALEWLKLNHIDYQNIEISNTNLESYQSEEGVFVGCDYVKIDDNESDALLTSSHGYEDTLEGTESGNCPFIVHGISGDKIDITNKQELKKIIAIHLKENNGKLLYISHSENPVDTFNNYKLFPQMFPHLFPYGLGGIGNPLHIGPLSSKAHKKFLHLYYDKRFQLDPNFSLIAFNTEQMKQSSSEGGHIIAQRKNIGSIIARLQRISTSVLNDISTRMVNGEQVKPQTSEEKDCFSLLNDIDVVASKVSGSITSKKHMRSEIWSLISMLGAPTWFITFAPSDVKHPICLYFADTDTTFKPEIKCSEEREKLIAQNPTAAARFFDFMVKNFIKHILGVGTNHNGLYGKTKAYYGTVEQQGRLTLHLHLLLWLQNTLSPQQIRDRIIENNIEFQKALIEYLENAHTGDFGNKSADEVASNIIEKTLKSENYIDPTLTMPSIPPLNYCSCQNDKCLDCIKLNNWWKEFYSQCDEIAYKSNKHSQCRKGRCLDKNGNCKARFPRDIVKDTIVDLNSGTILLKKNEKWWNTWSPVLSYLLRCNHDVTCLLSGTAVKAIVMYVTDYITKSSLKTHAVFSIIKDVFSEFETENLDNNAYKINNSKSFVRKMIVRIVNRLSSQLEIGSPMAAMYMLDLPDHYTNYTFIPFYWTTYVNEVRYYWSTNYSDKNNNSHLKSFESIKEETVILGKKGYNKYIPISKIDDYIYRSSLLSNVCVYDWVLNYIKVKRCSSQQYKFNFIKNLSNTDFSCLNIDNISDDELNIEESYKYNIDKTYINKNNSNNSINTSDIYDIYSDSSDDMNLFLDKNENYIKPINCMNFLNNHPQYDTHYITKNKSNFNALNFIGGSLPRQDVGDREYYCCCMLTLFKPWRVPADLKSIDESWENAFTQFNFSDQQKQLMNNFNIKYECYDARDDHYHNRKSNKLFSFDFEAHKQEANVIDITNDLREDVAIPIDDAEEYNKTSHREQINRIIMDQMERDIKQSGMYNENNEKYILDSDILNFKSNTIQTAVQWKSVVELAKAEAIKNMHIQADSSSNLSVSNKNSHFNKWNEVFIDDISYIDKEYKCREKKLNELVDNIITDFSLTNNNEQLRAFKIVSNHILMDSHNQLLMYLGGMGGTGKSQIIKSLKNLFEKRNEAYRMLVCAPTGAAAALIQGSTYHSILGMGYSSDTAGVHKAREHLYGVNYIFIDEISMLSLLDIYKISERLCRITNIMDRPFGGMNIILAGDLAQLPPFNSKKLWQEVNLNSYANMSSQAQKEIIGKALWHQFNTVVILKKNMRQKIQSEDDNRLRTALENMRYAACTSDDIIYLNSRIANQNLNSSILSSPEFRYTSVITGRNVQRDRLNELGCERIARELNQKLHYFYSYDVVTNNNIAESKTAYNKQGKNRLYYELSESMKQMLWNIPPSSTNHFPGILPLCIGMPVMIKHNDATELNVTNGQEAVVVHWESVTDNQDREYLETLFIKLKNPAKPVKLTGLPLNIIPMSKTSCTTRCICPNGQAISVLRTQVQVILNFSMTDYNSQGRSRVANPVNLSASKDFHNYYTALSRSVSHAGTVIIGNINSDIITKGISGRLRQEFRELELLAYITELRFNNELPTDLIGQTRNKLISRFKIWKGSNYVPSTIPTQLKWDSSSPLNDTDNTSHIKWTFANNNSLKENINKHSSDILLKRKIEEDLDDRKIKKRKLTNSSSGPIGFKWDNINYSCSYDAILVILYDIWIYNPIIWSNNFKNITNIYTKKLIDLFLNISQKKLTSIQARDSLRALLYSQHPVNFPYGFNYSSVTDVATNLLSSNKPVSKLYNNCLICGISEFNSNQNFIFQISSNNNSTINNAIQYYQTNKIKKKCLSCNTICNVTMKFIEPPKIIIAACDYCDKIKSSKTLKILYGKDDKYVRLALRGIVYFINNNHFISRIITLNKEVWFNDGMINNGNSEYECLLSEISDDKLSYYSDKLGNKAFATLFIYARQ